MNSKMGDVTEPKVIDRSAHHAAVRDFFEEHRRTWLDRYQSSSFDARNYRRRADVALALLKGVPWGRRRLLDVGCGAGVQAAAADRLGWTVSATDLTVALLHQAREEFPSPHWIAATAEDLPFPEGAFDVIVMLGVIGYVSEPVAVLRILRELLVPRGHLIVSWARDHTLMESVSHVVSALPDQLYMAAKHILVDGAAPTPSANTSFYTSYNRFWNQKAFTTLLTGVDFTVRKTRSVNFGQLRFMDHAIWPERVDTILSAGLERAVGVPGLGWLGQFTRTHIALLQRNG